MGGYDGPDCLGTTSYVPEVNITLSTRVISNCERTTAANGYGRVQPIALCKV